MDGLGITYQLVKLHRKTAATWVQAVRPPSGAGPGSTMLRVLRREATLPRVLLVVCLRSVGGGSSTEFDVSNSGPWSWLWLTGSSLFFSTISTSRLDMTKDPNRHHVVDLIRHEDNNSSGSSSSSSNNGRPFFKPPKERIEIQIDLVISLSGVSMRKCTMETARTRRKSIDRRD